LKSLFKNNNKIYKYDNGFQETTLQEPLTEWHFTEYGYEGIPPIAQWAGFEGDIEILAYTTGEEKFLEITTNSFEPVELLNGGNFELLTFFEGDFDKDLELTTNPRMPLNALPSPKLVAYSNQEEYSIALTKKSAKVIMDAVPLTQTIKASGDIDITGVEVIESIVLNANELHGGAARVAISVDSGTTYKVWNGTSWITVNVNDKQEFKNLGFSRSTLLAVTSIQFALLRGESNTIRFAYLLDRPTYGAVAEHDSITINVALQGITQEASRSDYTIDYDFENNQVTYNFAKAGTYTIAYAE
jgi:hypothetical protein